MADWTEIHLKRRLSITDTGIKWITESSQCCQSIGFYPVFFEGRKGRGELYHSTISPPSLSPCRVGLAVF